MTLQLENAVATSMMISELQQQGNNEQESSMQDAISEKPVPATPIKLPNFDYSSTNFYTI